MVQVTEFIVFTVARNQVVQSHLSHWGNFGHPLFDVFFNIDGIHFFS